MIHKKTRTYIPQNLEIKWENLERSAPSGMNNAMIDKNNQLLERDNKQGTGEENSNFSIMNNQEGFRSQMQEQKSQVGTLSSAIDHFVPHHGELRSWAIPLL